MSISQEGNELKEIMATDECIKGSGSGECPFVAMKHRTVVGAYSVQSHQAHLPTILRVPFLVHFHAVHFSLPSS